MNLFKELQKIMAGYEFLPTDNDNYFGTKHIPVRKYRDEHRNLIITSGIRQFYVSSRTHGSDGIEFRYMIIWTKGIKRPYWGKSYFDVELDKVFLSGKTDEELIENLKKLCDGQPV